MKTKILLATHGKFAEGILGSLHLIAGELGDIEAICAYTVPGVDYANVFRSKVSEFDYQKESLLVLTDIFGGSVNNEFMVLNKNYPFHLVTGLNLPMLIEFALAAEELDAQTVANVIKKSGEQVIYCTPLISEDSVDQKDEDF